MNIRLFPRMLLSAAAIFAAHSSVIANHGPGASGGGNATISGETLPEGKWELSIREDYVQFEHFDRAAAEARAQQYGGFDALSHGFLTTLDVSYGVLDDLQLGATLGFFDGRQFLSADLSDSGDLDVGHANPSGLTDLNLSVKYRLFKGHLGNLALITGVVVPTGRSNIRLDSGERVAPTDQPGTGRWALPMGLSYSRYLTSHLTLDVSGLYTRRWEKDFFRVGDRIDTGVALAYRINDSVRSFPQLSVFGELFNVYLFRDYQNGSYDPNSGGETLYLSPGLRVRFDPHVSMTVAPALPVYQDLNGSQGQVDFKCSVTLSVAF